MESTVSSPASSSAHPYPFSASQPTPPPHADFPADSPYNAFRDFLQGPYVAAGTPGNAGGSGALGLDGLGSPAGGGDFHSLFDQFTLPGGATSPQNFAGMDGQEGASDGAQQGQTQDVGGLMAMLASMGGAEAGAAGDGPGGAAVNGGETDRRTPQELLAQQLTALVSPMTATRALPAEAAAPMQQLPPNAHAQMQQLLAQVLGGSVNGQGSPTPTLETAHHRQPSFHAPQSPATFSQPQQHQHPSPTRPHSQASSAHVSPMPSHPPHPSSSAAPPYSNVAGPSAGSPYLHASHGAGGPTPSRSAAPNGVALPASAPLPAGFPLPAAFQQALAQPPFALAGLPGVAQNPITLQAQIAAMQLLVNAQAQVAQQQQAAQVQAMANAQAQMQQTQQQQQQHGGAMSMAPPQGPPGSNGSLTAPSLATSLDGSYRENEYLFSPLMSPAMAPHSAFTNASSLPPSVGPSGLGNASLVSPSDFFPPLTSPALGPQTYPSDAAHRLATHRNSLQGLVDGVGALSTQLPGSPSGYFPGPSPRLGPSDTSVGAGRRGAGAGVSKKSRPSPLIKPTDPGAERRRRKPTATGLNGSGAEKRNGGKSGTTSPYIGPSAPHARASSAASASATASAASFDTPSPVDLGAGPPPSIQSVQQSQYPAPPADLQAELAQNSMLGVAQVQPQQGYQPELMGPPPLPSSSTSYQPIAPAAPFAAPVTPASFMNLPTDFDMNTLSSLSPHLGPQGGYDASSVPGSAFSSVYNSPAILPQGDGAMPPFSLGGGAISTSSSLPALPALAPAPLRPDQEMHQDAFLPPPAPAAAKATKPRKAATDAKGKGKAAAGAAKKGRAAAAEKEKVKTRPLLASGADAEAQARLASKTNYENILAGHGNVLGLPASTSSQLQAHAATTAATSGPDNRRSSHKVAEQKRRDSLKLCFDELRTLLPPILPYTDESDRRPGDGNVGGQRHGEIDPSCPNKGVSKVALLRRSNEYLEILRERIERRDRAIGALREQLAQLRGAAGLPELGEEEDEVPGLDLNLDALDKEEKAAGPLAFYEDLDFDSRAPLTLGRKPSARRASTSASGTYGMPAAVAATGEKQQPKRRSTRTSQGGLSSLQPQLQQQEAMEVEGTQ
ncbi:hypothetical protein JCM10213_005178 [Rhodosporidiobolus nylandii]